MHYIKKECCPKFATDPSQLIQTYDRNEKTRKNARKTQKSQKTNEVFFTNYKNQETEVFAFCVITFEPIEFRPFQHLKMIV